MGFDYEQSIWGRGYASLSPTILASFRLQQSLRALRLVASGGKVLEVGSGAGQFIRSVKRARKDLDCFGCDISKAAIEVATTANDGVNYAVSGETLPYVDASIDAVLVYDVLEHVSDVPAFLREIFRVLKPGGIFYASVPCEGDWLSLWNLCRHLGWKGDLTRKYAGHINYFSRKSLRAEYTKAGFSSITFRYSEHILGQLLIFVAFNLMDRAARKKGLQQINGEDYFKQLNETIAAPGLYRFVKGCVNSLVYFESWLLNRVPSPNVHSIVKK